MIFHSCEEAFHVQLFLQNCIVMQCFTISNESKMIPKATKCCNEPLNNSFQLPFASKWKIGVLMDVNVILEGG